MYRWRSSRFGITVTIHAKEKETTMKSKTRSRVIIFGALAILGMLVIVLAIFFIIGGYFSYVVGDAVYHLEIEPKIDR